MEAKKIGESISFQCGGRAQSRVGVGKFDSRKVELLSRGNVSASVFAKSRLSPLWVV
jgi:hypothetical protein